MNNFLRTLCSGAKNFFPLPNAIFTLGLSAGELAVYAYLMYCEDRKSHQYWPSYKTIVEAVGMSKNTVQKYVWELEYKTLILSEPTKYENASGQVRNGNLIFTILPIQGAIKCYNECLLWKWPVCGPCEGRVRRTEAVLEEQGESRPKTPFCGICGDL